MIYEIRTKTPKSTALETAGPETAKMAVRCAPGGQQLFPETRADPRVFITPRSVGEKFHSGSLAEGKKPGSNTFWFGSIAISD